jgi:citronellyl-CoA dehydrogenase
MAIGVQTDMTTPTRSNEVRQEFLAPSISGDRVACIGVSEHGAASDVAAIKTKAVRDGGDYANQWHQDADHQRHAADWMCMLANSSDRTPHDKTLISVRLRRRAGGT